jgi:mono/diheme cytochrome c family protein
MHTLNTALISFFLFVLLLAGCGGDSGTSTTSGTISGTSGSSVVVKNNALPVATQGSNYTTFLGATGGKAPYRWTIETGKLPTGLTLNSDGNISGTPKELGSFTVVFKAVDSSSPPQSAQAPLQINVSSLVFTPGTSGSALYGDHCAYCHKNLGAADQQHKGATLTQIKAAIAADTGGMGEFGKSGIFPLSDAELTLIVNAISGNSSAYITPSFTTTTLPAAKVGTAYSQTLNATNGTLPYKWSTMGGSIPPGLTLNAISGVISGTPTTAGSYTATYMLSDANPATMVHQNITIAVNAAAVREDGIALYASKCAACHNPLASSTKKGRTAAQIQAAISGVGSMSSLSTLTAAEVAAIAAANP